MAMRQATIVLAWLVPVASLLAGCVGDSGENARLHYKGDGVGTDEDSAKCDSDGTLSSTGDVESGQVEITVTDGDGKGIYAKTFDGGMNVDGEALDGAKGEWTLRATRTSDTILGGGFNGSYSVLMTC
jgi:hypothetical protein